MKKTNQYINELFAQSDDILEKVLGSIREKGMKSISVSPASGKLLTMLVAISGAKRVLEIGALGGYSGICLARGFGEEGHLTSLELQEEYADLAKSNLEMAGFGGQTAYRTGPALDSLNKLKEEGKTFDFFFIDADKGNYRHYLDGCIELAEPGALITADNVLAGGSVADTEVEPRGFTDKMKDFNEYVAGHPRLESVLLPIGDGITLSRVQK